MMLERDKNVAWGASTSLFFALLLLTRHTQIDIFHGLLVPYILLILFLQYDCNKTFTIFVPIIFYATLSFMISVASGNDILDATRFFVIILATLLSFNVRSKVVSQSLVLAPLLFQCVVISIIAIVLAYLQDDELAKSVRQTVLEHNLGDIYTFDGFYYRVQLIGNALLPLFFMLLLFLSDKNRVLKLLLLISGLSLFAAGNLTYWITAGIAICIRYKNLLVKHWVATITILLTAICLILSSGAYTVLIEQKFEGSSSSMGVRYDQIDVVEKVFKNQNLAIIFGKGLGARLPDGNERNYSDDLYIELQGLYLAFQLGLLGSSLYILTLVFKAHNTLSMDGRIIFWLYILSGATNPYILDSNQVLATMLLVNLYPRYRSSKR